jgi:hypothetical protein
MGAGLSARIALILTLSAGVANARVFFVSASAPTGGDGSQRAPFNTLAAVEQASAPGDEIVILPSPLSAPPLDHGIALKPHQKLTGGGASVVDGATLTEAPRITNSTAASNSGDAVVLADDAEVKNLVIVNSYRGGVYGSDVTQVNIHDNNFSGTNTSCTPGFFVIFPQQISLLPNGWAAIMVDEDKGIASISIRNNYIHDGTCNDGIDLRATGSAQVMARVDTNNITHLAQGPKMRSLLGIGVQTRDTAVLTVNANHNSETYIGSPNADCEGLFSNQTGGSLTWNIDHNNFAHGIGGLSCNGGEFFLSNGPATANLYISHSTFEDNPGDMIEEIDEASSSSMNLTLEEVTVRHTTQEKPSSPEPKFSVGFGMDVNRSRCLSQSSHGRQNENNLRVIRSRLFDCAGDGIGTVVNGGAIKLPPSLGLPADTIEFGDGTGDSVSIDVEDSVISGSQQDAMHFRNQVQMKDLWIRVENSYLGDAKGAAIVAFDQNASTEHSDIDLGGKQLDSSGGNCIVGPTNLALEVTGYDVAAKSNWWGLPDGPNPSAISVTSGNFVFAPPLHSAPSSCNAKNQSNSD